MNAILVFLGGGLGALVRWQLSRWNTSPLEGFPYGTFWANALSCLILSVFLFVGKDWIAQTQMRLLAVVGFCGGFSTFSTFSWELFQLLQQGKVGVATLYFLTSLGVSLLLFWGVSRCF